MEIQAETRFVFRKTEIKQNAKALQLRKYVTGAAFESVFWEQRTGKSNAPNLHLLLPISGKHDAGTAFVNPGAFQSKLILNNVVFAFCVCAFSLANVAGRACG